MFKLRTLGLVIVALMFGMSLWGAAHVPEGPMAVHFNIRGEADGYVPRDMGLFLMPVIALALAVMFIVLPKIMPKKGSLERSSEAYGAIMLGALLLQLVVHFLLIAEAIGSNLDTMAVAFSAIGLLFVVMGNYLPKTRYNYVMGIRTPWTLADERVWDRTHRLAGPLFMLGGAATIAAVLIAGSEVATKVLMVGVFVPAIVAIAYSWHLARRLGA